MDFGGVTDEFDRGWGVGFVRATESEGRASEWFRQGRWKRRQVDERMAAG